MYYVGKYCNVEDHLLEKTHEPAYMRIMLAFD
jgi:hypothetical protein